MIRFVAATAAVLVGLALPPMYPAQAAESGQMRFAQGSLKPAMISLKAGDTVRWTNEDTVKHALLTDADAPATIRSGPIAPGATYVYKVPKGGTYNFRCPMHEGEVGMLMVSNADGSYPSPSNGNERSNPVRSVLAPVLPPR